MLRILRIPLKIKPMMNYKYSLEKGSKKHFCPHCNKKRYVRYIDIETNEYLEYPFGRCDRITSCGYFKQPSICETTVEFIPKSTQNNKISTITNSLVNATLKNYEKNNFFIFLTKYFDERLVLDVFKKYQIGSSKKWKGATIFWQNDTKNRFRTGKIMLYNSSNGKRVKHPYNHISWAHTALKIDNYNLKQCLFGLHLVSNNKKIIGLVEAEKTAVTMDLFLPNCNWMATGSKQNLKEELLYPIKDCEIIVYPDKGEFDDWNKKCNELINKGFNIRCSSLVEKSSLAEGSDLADIYFDLYDNKQHNITLTKIELKAKRLNSINYNVSYLIETFELTDLAGNEIRSYLL